MTTIGSREHWRDERSFLRSWEFRSRQAVRFIAPGADVLDIGCGPHMTLRGFLPPACTYVPADLYQWTPEVRLVDVDADVFPDGLFDCITLLGVLEYLRQPERVFRFARRRSPAMVLSYCHPNTVEREARQAAGWVNAYSVQELGELVAGSGWHIADSETVSQSPQTHQLLHCLLQG